MRKIEGLLFGGYWLIILGVITALFSGESSHHIRKSHLLFEGELSRPKQSWNELGFYWFYLLRERRLIPEFDSVSLLQLSKNKSSKSEKKKKKKEEEEKKKEEKKKKKEEKKKKKEEKKKKKEEKKKKKEEKKKEKEEKKKEKEEKKKEKEEINKLDSSDESYIKDLGKNNGIPKRSIEKKLKKLKKQLEEERKLNPEVRLKSMFERSGGFGGAGAGSFSELSSSSDSSSISDLSGHSSSKKKKLSRKERRQRKKQDKNDEVKIISRMIASGFSKNEARSKVSNLKKILKDRRNSGDVSTTLLGLFESSGDAHEEAESDDQHYSGKLAALESKVERLTRANKKRKKEIRKLSINLSKLAYIVRSQMAKIEGTEDSNHELTSSSDDDE